MATLIKSNGEEIIVTPNNKTDFSLGEMQKFVGTVKTKNNKIMVINEEGKINDLPINQKATDLYKYGDFDFIVGDVLICNENEI
jgi:exoribonuclease II